MTVGDRVYKLSDPHHSYILKGLNPHDGMAWIRGDYAFAFYETVPLETLRRTK